MKIMMFAAIDIGSYEVGMKIFELSAKYGMREIDYIRHRIELGRETYSEGKIGFEVVNELCRVLKDFASIMKTYEVSSYRAYATSAIREADNDLIVLNQIKVKTGLDVTVLSNSEQRFIDYKAIAAQENDFNKIIQKGTAIVDVSGGSIQVSLFDKDKLVTTQNARLGSLRIREKLAHLEDKTAHFNELIEELIETEVDILKKLYLKDREIQNIIVVGDYGTYIVQAVNESIDKKSISREKFMEFFEEIEGLSVEKCAEKLGSPIESATLIMPSLFVYKRLMEATGANFIWTPGLHLVDGIAYDYAEKHKYIQTQHNFENDILAAAKNISKRYMCNKSHTAVVEPIALHIFDTMKAIHGLGKREKLLLQIAVLLHDCGKYISLFNAAECSYNIIMSTEIIGLSHNEREIIANLVKYNTLGFERSYEEVGEVNYLIVAKLTAILRVANAMDRSHKSKCKNCKMSLRDKKLLMVVEGTEDITLERGLFGPKADFFEEVYGIRPVIKHKRNI